MIWISVFEEETIVKRLFKSAICFVLLSALILGFIPVFPAATVEVSAVERKTYKHVVVVGIDGMGNYNQKTSTPNIDKLFKNNPNAAWTDYAMASNPNISAQCWTSMLTGVTPATHGINNSIVEDTSIKYNNATYPTLFKLIRQARPNAKMACFSSWIGPANGMVEVGLGVDTLYTGYDDAKLCSESVSYIKANKPEFFFCVFNDVDASGHSKNWGSTDYLNTLTRVDGYLGQVYQAVVDAGMLEDTLFICTTDHGGWTNGHGVRTVSTKYCFFGAIGSTIMPNTQVYTRGMDIAPIVAYAMNVPGNSKWEGGIPQYLFADYPEPAHFSNPQTLAAGRGNRVTPASGLDDYLGNYIDMNKLETALFFDGNVQDYMGNQNAAAMGNVEYVTGYFGQGVNLQNGYVSLPDLEMGTDSFSIGLWMKQTDKYASNADPIIFGNKRWGTGYGATDGVVFTEWGNDPAFRVSANNTNSQHRADYPDEAQTVVSYDTSGSSWVVDGYDNCWVHVLLVVDRPNNKLKVYYNFALAGEYTMASWVNGISFDTEYDFHIGQDATGEYSVKLKSYLDDFMFFNTNLTEDDVAGLRRYYMPVSTGSAPTKASVWLEKKQFDANENVRFYYNADGYSTNLWIYNPDGTSVHHDKVASPYTLKFATPGQYEALVQTWNGKGSFTSQRISFTVGNPPADGTVVTSKDTYAVNEDVFFTIYGAGDSTDLHIERADGKWTKTVENVATTYDLAFGWAGTYVAYAVTTNNLGVTAGPKTYFVIGSPTMATITFKDHDGTVIETKSYGYGETVIPPADPVLAGNIFAGWDKTIVPVDGDAVYTARYIPDISGYYTVVFKNWDGTVISETTYKYGDAIVAPANPTKAADNINTYTFTGWDSKVDATCYRDVTYTAQFSATKKAYTVIFKNWDGTVISTKTYGYGDTVTVPANPTKAADNTNTYTFTGWDKTVASTCAGDATYTAQFSATKISYTVIFKDHDGAVISTATYGYGDAITVPKDPAREGYTFTGWDKTVATICAGDATYTAVYVKEDLPTYTVTFKNWDGSVISSVTYNAGATVNIPADPTKAADETYTYAFTGWDKDVDTTCNGDATYIAQFSATKISYTVVFKDYDGTVISEQTYSYGDEILIPETPERTGYIFMGWDEIVSETCAGDAIYTATYEEEDIDIPEFILGDVNADGEIDISDFVQMKSHLLGKITLTDNNLLAADVNGDGDVDISDFVLLKSHLLGKTTIGA